MCWLWQWCLLVASGLGKNLVQWVRMSWSETLGNVTDGVSWMVGWRAGRFGSEQCPAILLVSVHFARLPAYLGICSMDFQVSRNARYIEKPSLCDTSRTRCCNSWSISRSPRDDGRFLMALGGQRHKPSLQSGRVRS